MVAVVGGLGAAVFWAISNLSSARSTRMIGAASVLSWVMVVGLALNIGAIAVTRAPIDVDAHSLMWMAMAGFGNALGLLLLLGALSLGKVGPATSITSTEGAVAATFSVLAGEQLPALAYVALLVIVVGVLILTASASASASVPGHVGRGGRAAGLAVGAALLSGLSIFATGHISGDVPLVWVVLPPRIVGVVVLALPLALTGRLRLTLGATPFIALTGAAEIAGWLSYTLGARESIAIAAVLASLFAATATLGAFLLFGERLARRQAIGIAVVAAGVAALAAVSA